MYIVEQPYPPQYRYSLRTNSGGKTDNSSNGSVRPGKDLDAQMRSSVVIRQRTFRRADVDIHIVELSVTLVFALVSRNVGVLTTAKKVVVIAFDFIVDNGCFFCSIVLER